jgi:hypothetical protein
MKKILLSAMVMGLLFTSCKKDETEVYRNWFSPDGTEFCSGGAATGESGTVSYNLQDNLTDEQLVRQIKENNNLPNHYTIFLTTVLYGGQTAPNIDPAYLAFPKVIDSMASKWSHAYIIEFDEDEQAFLDKYCNGEKTGAMIYCNL